MTHHSIPIALLNMQLDTDAPQRTESVLENEIAGVSVEHVALAHAAPRSEPARAGHSAVYLFIKGEGVLVADGKRYEIVPETVFVPIGVDEVVIEAAGEGLHWVRVSAELTPQDLIDQQTFPTENTQAPYYAKFTDCQAYTEAIKSPKTVSRTILPNKIIPRIAMGTVHTTGPDGVGAHEHPMLEQLFLGLSQNNCVVYADDDQIDFPEHSILHVPLGSSHSVSVAENKVMYYIWMDFFLDKQGEEWLQTHKAIENDV